MKKFLIMFVVAYVVVFLIATFGVKWDLWIHPWVQTTVVQNWQWYHYLTSEHSVTVIYLIHYKLWLMVLGIGPLIISSAFAVDR